MLTAANVVDYCCLDQRARVCGVLPLQRPSPRLGAIFADPPDSRAKTD
jgi:hypothetical protein